MLTSPSPPRFPLWRLLCALLGCGLFWHGGALPLAQADTALQARLLYRKAYLLFKKKQWPQARRAFLNTLRLLRQRHSSLQGRAKSFNDLGICDIHYHLSLIAFTQNKNDRACRRLARLRKRLRTIPNDWPNWPINPLLPKRFEDASFRFQRRCVNRPSRLTLQGLPPNTTIELAQPSTATRITRWKVVQQPIPLTQTSARLRLKAKGYFPRILQVEVPRWSKVTRKVTLKKKPPPRRVLPPRRPPRRPPPPPQKTSPWVWVGVGLGAAAVTAGAITATYLLTRPERPDTLNGRLATNVWQ